MNRVPIVYFGNDWFADNRTSSHHIARCLAKRFRVLYADSPGLRAPGMNRRDVGKIRKKLAMSLSTPKQVFENIWHITIPQFPFRTFRGAAALNRVLSVAFVRRAMRKLDIANPLLWFAVPHTEPVVGRLGERGVVYYCIDDYSQLPGVASRQIADMDERLARRADQVFVSSPALFDPKKALNPHTVYSPHGVDVDFFGRAADRTLPVPERIRNLPHPVIGFFGLMESWFDMDLLRYLAVERPNWQFLMIGRVAVSTAGLETLGNVHFVGPQPYESLPDWTRAFDVAIIPFRDSQLVKAVNPLKLREYLAAGKPVVSTWMPELDRFADLIGIEREPRRFLERIEAALESDSEEQRRLRMSRMAPLSWSSRVDEVLRVVEERIRLGAPNAASVK